jgi:hypothetical protein
MKAYEDKKEDIFIKNDIVDSNEYIVTELENLCISLKILIEQKSLPISNDTEIGRRDMNILETMITNNMEWIVNNIHTKKESDINEESIEKVAVEKLEILNTLCSDIYSRSVSNIFNENDNTNVIVTSEDADTTYNNTGGTSIMELMKARQDSGMNEKDNDENIDEDKFFNDMNEMNDENI